MNPKELASVVPHHYNSVLRWVNKVPSTIQYNSAVSMEAVTGIPWGVWCCGYAYKVTTVQGTRIDIASSWDANYREAVTIKELLKSAPYGIEAADEFQRRMKLRESGRKDFEGSAQSSPCAAAQKKYRGYRP